MLQQAVYLHAVQVFASIRTLLPRRVRKNYKIRIINHVFNWQPQEKSWTNIFATHEWWSEFIPWVFASKWCLRNIDWKAPWKPVSAIWNDSISTHTHKHTHHTHTRTRKQCGEEPGTICRLYGGGISGTNKHQQTTAGLRCPCTQFSPQDIVCTTKWP